MFKFSKSFLMLALVTLCLGMAACETLDGAGRDIENAGESIQDAAE